MFPVAMTHGHDKCNSLRNVKPGVGRHSISIQCLEGFEPSADCIIFEARGMLRQPPLDCGAGTADQKDPPD